MIQEHQPNAGFGVSAPATGVHQAGSIGYDLNPSFGQGAQAQRSPLLNQSGEELVMRVTVTVAFVADLGAGGEAPVAQFHVVLSDTTAGSVINTANYVSIGCSCAPVSATAAGRLHFGYLAEDLTVGKHFFIRMNPWTREMGQAAQAVPGAHTAINGYDLRYVGLVIQNESHSVASCFFSAGTVVGNFVKNSDIMQDPGDFAYPVGMSVVG